MQRNVQTLRIYLRHEVMQQFVHSNMLTSLLQIKIPLPATVKIASTQAHMQSYRRLLQQNKLSQLNSLQMSGQHFVVIKDDKVVAGVTILCAAINNFPGSIAISIEKLVSVNKGSAALLLNMLHRFVMKRAVACARTCFLVTQCLENKTSREFWAKRMNRHKKALLLNFMFFMLNSDFQIYEDVDFMYREY
ncbi:MAG: hypothetical protein CL450_07970 [Acidimicrobiaceae bacterium]|nr:hypothetical protein [Acidimicrobiaceae bacterium]